MTEFPVPEDLAWFAWNTVSCADGWTELDQSDVVRLYVLPRLKKRRHEWAELHHAIRQTEQELELWDNLYRILDEGVRIAGAADNFSDWADSMSEYDGN